MRSLYERTTMRLGIGMLALAALSCGSEKSGGPSGTGMSATMMVTASAGGTVTLEGTTLPVPPGALPADTVITITSSTAAPPSGCKSWNSPVFTFEPDGLAFLMPVAMTITLTGSPAAPAVHWSSSTHGVENLGGTVQGNRITAFVTHFSQGFVAEGGDVDAGVAPPVDGSSVHDASPVSDSGAPQPDGGLLADASVPDGGVPIDGGFLPDASLIIDGSVQPDGGPPPAPDGGPPPAPDGGTPSPDGGVTPFDAGPAPDGPPQPDGGSPAPDGGAPPPDAGPLPDSGTSPDGGSSPIDAAPLPDAPLPDAGI
jgi:hypothetical protein